MIRAGGLAALALLACAAPASAAQTLTLDLADPRNASPAGVVQTAPLTRGESYVMVVTGSGSVWPGRELSAPSAVCGTPQAAPLTASPGRENGPSGLDAQSLYAAPAGSKLGDAFTCNGALVPRNTGDLYTAFEVALTSGAWARPVPVGGLRTRPRADHTYVYEAVGTGAPAAFRFVDTPATDNYGVFGITVLTAAECASIRCQGGSAGSPGFDAGTGGDARVAPTPVGNPAAGTAVAVRSCAMTLPIRVRTRSGVTLSSATVKVAGKTATKLGRKAVRKAVTLRVLPAKSFTVRVSGKTTKGKTVSVQRRVAGCRKASKTPLTFRVA